MYLLCLLDYGTSKARQTFRSLLSSWSSSGPLISCLMKISLYSDRQSTSSQTPPPLHPRCSLLREHTHLLHTHTLTGYAQREVDTRAGQKNIFLKCSPFKIDSQKPQIDFSPHIYSYITKKPVLVSLHSLHVTANANVCVFYLLN